METSSDITKIAAALAAAQASGELVAIKDRPNGHLKTDYADLCAVMDCARPVMQKVGLALTQWPGSMRHEGECAIMQLTNVLLHAESGQWMRETMEIPLPEAIMSRQGGGPVINIAQRMGSALSYARRYGWLSILGIATGDDDDAQRAFEKAQATNNAPRDQSPTAGPQTWQQLYETGDWKEKYAPGDGQITLGSLSTAEMWPHVKANKVNGFANLSVVAASAHVLNTQATKVKMKTVAEALTVGGWQGSLNPLEMTPDDLYAACRVVIALPNPPTEPPTS